MYMLKDSKCKQKFILFYDFLNNLTFLILVIEFLYTFYRFSVSYYSIKFLALYSYNTLKIKIKEISSVVYMYRYKVIEDIYFGSPYPIIVNLIQP